MDQIEKPLSILLIIAAIAFVFMYTDAGDGFTAIENKTTNGYTIESAELLKGYNIESAELSKGYNVIGDLKSECIDSIAAVAVDTIWYWDETTQTELFELIFHDQSE